MSVDGMGEEIGKSRIQEPEFRIKQEGGVTKRRIILTIILDSGF